MNNVIPESVTSGITDTAMAHIVTYAITESIYSIPLDKMSTGVGYSAYLQYIARQYERLIPSADQLARVQDLLTNATPLQYKQAITHVIDKEHNVTMAHLLAYSKGKIAQPKGVSTLTQCTQIDTYGASVLHAYVIGLRMRDVRFYTASISQVKVTDKWFEPTTLLPPPITLIANRLSEKIYDEIYKDKKINFSLLNQIAALYPLPENEITPKLKSVSPRTIASVGTRNKILINTNTQDQYIFNAFVQRLAKIDKSQPGHLVYTGAGIVPKNYYTKVYEHAKRVNIAPELIVNSHKMMLHEHYNYTRSLSVNIKQIKEIYAQSKNEQFKRFIRNILTVYSEQSTVHILSDSAVITITPAEYLSYNTIKTKKHIIANLCIENPLHLISINAAIDNEDTQKALDTFTELLNLIKNKILKINNDQARSAAAAKVAAVILRCNMPNNIIVELAQHIPLFDQLDKLIDTRAIVAADAVYNNAIDKNDPSLLTFDIVKYRLIADLFLNERMRTVSDQSLIDDFIIDAINTYGIKHVVEEVFGRSYILLYAAAAQAYNNAIIDFISVPEAYWLALLVTFPMLTMSIRKIFNDLPPSYTIDYINEIFKAT